MNTPTLIRAVVCVVSLNLFASLHAGTGFFGDGTGAAIFYVTDGSTSGEGTYRNVGNLSGLNYGEFSVGSLSLLLRGGEGKTYKNGSGDVYGVTQYYRIYPSGGSAPTYSSFSLPFNANLGNGDQRWKTTSQNINLVSGLTNSGTYNVQYYWVQTGNEGDNFMNNGGSDYTTSFNLYYDITANAGTTNTQSAAGGNAIFAGNGKFVKRGGGATQITNANTSYSGNVYIDAGALDVVEGASLGSTNIYIGPDNTSGNATLNIGDGNGGTTIANNVIIRAGGGTRTVGGTNSSGVNEFSGAMYLDGSVTLTAATGGTVRYSSAIQQGSLLNTVNVAITGGGTVEFSGNDNNTGITLYTVGNGSTLKLNKTTADAVQSTLTIGSGGVAELAAANQFGSSAVITNNGTFAIGNFSDSFGTLNSSGDITGTGTLTAGTYNLSGGTVGANLGSGTLNVTGDITLNGASSATTVSVSGSGTDLTLGATANRLATNAVVTLAANSSVAFGASQTLARLTEVGTTNGGTASIVNGATLTISGDSYNGFQNSISGAGALTKSGSGTLALYGTQGYTGKTTINNGLLKTQNDIVSFASTNIEVTGGTFQTQSANVLSDSAAVTVNGGTYSVGGSDTIGVLSGTGGTVNITAGTLTATYGSGSSSYDGNITGGGAFSKAGGGILTLSGNNTKSGANTVSAGTLEVAGSLSGATTVQSGATLDVDGTLSGAVSVDNSGTIKGGGSVGTLTINGLLAPGNSAGTLTATNGASWVQGGSYDWEIFDLAGPAGTGWDLLDVTSGTLDLTGITTGGGFTINLITLTTNNSTQGSLDGFLPAATYTNWMIARAQDITGFSATSFSLNTNSFVGSTGTWAIAIGDGGGGFDGLFVTYNGGGGAPVPEPGTWAAAALLAGAAAYVRLRRRKDCNNPDAA